ncbi:MAG: hypothetical protein Q8L44_06680 [Sulfuritalea sp.]|nr:hypothetical protein [Sulfuritalea sp.]
MMSNQYQLLMTTTGAPRRVCRRSFDADARLEVRDLATRVTLRIRADEVSAYRHTLLLDGDEYQILNVVRLSINGGQDHAQNDVSDRSPIDFGRSSALVGNAERGSRR